jgi:hypothetical protein
MKSTLSAVLSAAHRRDLPCLLIGGNAVILLGFPRMTLDIDLDWEDIRQLVRAWHLDPADAYFREIILRYGGEEAVKRISSYSNGP